MMIDNICIYLTKDLAKQAMTRKFKFHDGKDKIGVDIDNMILLVDNVRTHFISISNYYRLNKIVFENAFIDVDFDSLSKKQKVDYNIIIDKLKR